MRKTPPRERRLLAIMFAAFPAFVASRGTVAAQHPCLFTPRVVVANAADAAIGAPCQPVTTAVSCVLFPFQAPAGLVLNSAEYELPRTELREVPTEADAALPDAGATPTPIVIALQPPDFTTTAHAVWVQDGEVVSVSPIDGKIIGPRVPPVEEFSLAIVGPETKPVILRQRRVPAQEPLTAQLESGSSAVIACRDPWNGTIVSHCNVELGAPSLALNAIGNARLTPHGTVTECGDLRVL